MFAVDRWISVCCVYFRSLGLANLRAALYSVRRQELDSVRELVVADNDTGDTEGSVRDIVDALDFPVPVRVLSFNHGDPTKTHAWSTNQAVRATDTPWVLFTRADYLLRFDALRLFSSVVGRNREWNGFVTGNGYHLAMGVDEAEQTTWRTLGPRVLLGYPGMEYDYSVVDTGVWMASRAAFDAVGGMDEALSAWGHAQTEFQHRLHKAGTEFMRIPEVLFFHPFHGAPRDIDVAHAQLEARGVNLKEMWARYHGTSPY